MPPSRLRPHHFQEAIVALEYYTIGVILLWIWIINYCSPHAKTICNLDQLPAFPRTVFIDCSSKFEFHAFLRGK